MRNLNLFSTLRSIICNGYYLEWNGLEEKIQPSGTTTFPYKNCFKIILGKKLWINSRYFFLILKSVFKDGGVKQGS